MNIDALVPHDVLQTHRTRLLLGDPLMDLEVKFNLFPALYLHESWADYLHLNIEPASLLKKLDAQPFLIRNLSADILRAFKLDQSFDFEFHDIYKRIVFVDAPVLQNLMNRVIALLMREQIRKVIRGREVKSMHRAMTADVHRWVLNYREELPILHSPCFQFEGKWPSSKVWQQFIDQVILSFVPTDAEAVLFRLKLKLPYESRQLQRLDMLEADRILIAELFVSFVELFHPEWSWLFETA